MDVFGELNGLNINGHTEKKNVGGKELTYVSWPWAWAEVKKRYPDAHYEIWRNDSGIPYSYDPATGFMVYTSVTIDGITHDMWLPVMDGANRAMKATSYTYSVKNPKHKYAKQDQRTGKWVDSYGNEQPEFLEKSVDAATMTDINKTIMRCLVKNLAMFGLGLYIYAGEDLPEVETTKEDEKERAKEFLDEAKEKLSKAPKATVSETVPTNPVKEYIANELTFMKEMFGIADTGEMAKRFAEMRKTLISEGLVEDIASDKLTMEQAADLFEKIYKRFKPSGEQA